MKKLKLLLYSSFLVLSSSLSFAQSWLWGTQGYGDLKANDYASPVATDKFGNAYIAGNFGDVIIFGTDTLKGASDNAYLVKYNSSGNVIWANKITDNTGESYAYSVATSKSGSIYITGLFAGSADAGAFPLSSGAAIECVYLAKYNTSGTVIWAKQSVSPNASCYGSGYGVTTDKSGNILVTGYFADTISFGSYTLSTPVGSTDQFLVKYDSNGNMLWAKQAQTKVYAYGNTVTTDNLGNVLVSGFFEDTVNFGTTMLHTNQSKTAFIAKYSSAGNVLWAKQGVNISTNTYSNPNSVITDEANNIYLTGFIYDTVKFGSHTLYSPGANSAFFVKYDINGNVIWAKESSRGWQGTALANDVSNTIYMAGITNVTAVDSIRFGNFKLNTNPSSHYASFLLRFDTSGAVMCGAVLNNLGSPGGGQINGLAVDSTGTYAYIAGTFLDTVICGPDTIIPSGAGANPLLARWQKCDGDYQGVDELIVKSEKLIVYPNPFTNTTTIALSDAGKHYLELDDLTGQKLRWIDFTGTQYQLQANDLAKGIYFIRAFDSDMNVIGTNKIIIQ